MALPYYLPPPIPMGAGVSTISAEQINKIYQQHNIQTMAFLRNMQHASPNAGFGFMPVPFKPYYTNTSPMNGFLKPQSFLDSFPFAHTVPKMMYPITPMPLRPLPFSFPPPSYQSQLKQVAKRVAASDAQAETKSKRRKHSESKPNPVDVVGDKLPSENSVSEEIIVVTDEEDSSAVKTPKPLSGSIMNPLFVGSDLPLNPDSTYHQQLLSNPGPGQKYINKIRSLVEGIPGADKKQKKVRQKSKNNENPSKNKNIKTPDTAITATAPAETESNIIPDNLHPDPEPRSSPYDLFVIGCNGTFLSHTYYHTIPWKCYKESTRILIGHFFTSYALASHSLDGDYPLNPNIIEDIINHVMAKCNVGRDSVREIISTICSEEAYKYAPTRQTD